jgi:hypothetical protein
MIPKAPLVLGLREESVNSFLSGGGGGALPWLSKVAWRTVVDMLTVDAA